jgi:hypothetical protein
VLPLQTRGYPVADFDQRAADISVDHPRGVENYRSAHSVALRLSKGEASTEDLRTAMIHYRSLFDELVQAQTPGERRVAYTISYSGCSGNQNSCGRLLTFSALPEV